MKDLSPGVHEAGVTEEETQRLSCGGNRGASLKSYKCEMGRGAGACGGSVQVPGASQEQRRVHQGHTIVCEQGWRQGV